MAHQNDPAADIPSQERKRPGASHVPTEGVPQSNDHTRLDGPPPGGDLARDQERKTPPDRNRGRTVDAP